MKELNIFRIVKNYPVKFHDQFFTRKRSHASFHVELKLFNKCSYIEFVFKLFFLIFHKRFIWNYYVKWISSHINYANLVWAQNSNAMSRILTLQKRLWELLLSNQGTAIQVLYFRNLNYLNSMIKSILKMCFWSVNLSIVSCHQSSTTGSLFALMFITMRQLHLLLVNYLNLLSALTYMEKIYRKCYWRLK